MIVNTISFVMVYPEFYLADWYTYQTYKDITGWHWADRFSKFVLQDTLKIYSLVLYVLHFSVKHFTWMIYYIVKWIKTLLLTVSCFSSTSMFHFFFVFCLYFCILRHFEMIRCIGKSLVTTSTYYLLKYYWKKTIWNMFFGWYINLPNGLNLLLI